MTPQLKETDYLKTWAIFAVCATIGGFIAGAIVGAIVGATMGVTGVSAQTNRFVCGIMGFIAGLPISYLFFRLFVSRFIVQKLTMRTVPDVETH